MVHSVTKTKPHSVRRRLSRLVYVSIRWVVRVFYPRITVEGMEHLPDDGCVVVGNHAKMNGPITAELYFPGERRIWCAAQMMDWRTVPSYAYNDFWRAKPLYIRWFYRLSSYVITPFSVCIFRNAHTIPVYHDSRIMTTFHQTLEALSDNEKVIIFPECAEPHNHIVNQFQNRFIDVARTYYNRTGKQLSFVPMYLAPRLKTARLGRPVTFDPDRPLAQERQRICDCLMEEITAMAEQMPLHTVVPYDNIPKKCYHTNRPDQETSHEKTNR